MLGRCSRFAESPSAAPWGKHPSGGSCVIWVFYSSITLFFDQNFQDWAQQPVSFVCTPGLWL